MFPILKKRKKNFVGLFCGTAKFPTTKKTISIGKKSWAKKATRRRKKKGQ